MYQGQQEGPAKNLCLSEKTVRKCSKKLIHRWKPTDPVGRPEARGTRNSSIVVVTGVF